MPSDPVELTKQIKAASDIVRVVGGYLTLTPAGRTFKALCPFHADSRPSLDVDPRLQRYRCWSCQAHGDVFGFVQHMEKVGFKEAREILATRAGIKLDGQQSPQDQARIRLLGAMRWAQEKYQHCLLNEAVAEPARTYLGTRKLSGKTVRDFGLGFAPLGGNWLVPLAAADRIDPAALAETGMLLERHERRGFFDRFQDRVMFPIRDVQGRAVGFGGRIMPESPLLPRAPKYYNSTETPLFSKSDVLYGLDLARHAGHAAGYLAVVEGYTDVMMAHQCGVPQVVATMGTALNARHVAQLRRYVPKVILVYDADAGGTTGVDRALELFVAHDVELAVAALPDGLDPCDLLIRPGGVEAFQQALVAAVDVLDFYFATRLGHEGTPPVEAARKILDQVLGVMAKSSSRQGAGAYSTTSQVKQELIVTRLASRLRLKFETVWARFGELVKKAKLDAQEQAKKAQPLVQASAARTTANPAAPKSGADTTCERQLLELLLANPWLVARSVADVSPAELRHTGLRRLLTELYSLQTAAGAADLDGLREQLPDRPDLYEAALKLQFVGQQMGRDPEERVEWYKRVVKRFADSKAEAEQRAVREELEAHGGDAAAAADLLRRLQQSAKTRTPG